MSKRLIWNFELSKGDGIKLPMQDATIHESIHWESRYFWPETEIITLHSLDSSFLFLSNYKIKHHSDQYFILPDEDYNIKRRHDAFLYKPICEQTPLATAFGKKIHLEECTEPLTNRAGHSFEAKALLDEIKNKGRCFSIEKEAAIYKFHEEIPAKMELSRITLKSKVFFSVSFESTCFSVVQYLANNIVRDCVPMDYVTFLKNIRTQ